MSGGRAERACTRGRRRWRGRSGGFLGAGLTRPVALQAHHVQDHRVVYDPVNQVADL